MTMLPADCAAVTAVPGTPSPSGLEKFLRVLSVVTMLMTVPQVLTVWVGRDAGGVSLLSWGGVPVLGVPHIETAKRVFR